MYPGVNLTVIIGTSEANKTSDVSIELDRGSLDFGTPFPGQASNSQVLNIRNTGKSYVKVTAEIGESSESVFFIRRISVLSLPVLFTLK